MSAWSEDTIPLQYLQNLSPVQRQGAVIFQSMQCRNCHSLGGQGGERGPTLDSVATRLTEDQLIRQVVQGGGNMPAYGKNLSPPEVTALVQFLDTLHPPGQVPATDAATAAAAVLPQSESVGPTKPGGGTSTQNSSAASREAGK